MKGNDGKGNVPERDLWETKQELWDELNNQYGFEFDCCASFTNRKTISFANDFETVFLVNKVAWMNPPFSKAKEMFNHFFQVVKKGGGCYLSLR